VGSGRGEAAQPRARKAQAGISAGALTHRIDAFLGDRGFRRGPSPDPATPAISKAAAAAQAGAPVTSPPSPVPASPQAVYASPPPVVEDSGPVDFVCEEDVRRAVSAGRTLRLAERAIVTPAARDLGEQHGIFRRSPG
jgi:hypothetical protein